MRLTEKRIIDLTKSIFPGMVVYPGDPVVTIEQLSALSDRFVLERLCMSTHTGTHVDAPFHVLNGGETLDEMPLDQFVLPAMFLNFCNLDKSKRLEKLEEKASELADKAIILRTDCTLSADITLEEANILIESHMKLIGVDAMSVEEEESLPVHRALLSRGIPIVEGLDNLANLDEGKKYLLVVAPMKLKGCSGAPARVFALEI
jgi:arylformamidase